MAGVERVMHGRGRSVREVDQHRREIGIVFDGQDQAPGSALRVAVAWEKADAKQPAELLVWGDSHAMAVLPAIDALCRESGKSALQATLDASGIGGDGSAVLYLKGMKRPTVIEYKDMTPIKATPDNPAIVQVYEAGEVDGVEGRAVVGAVGHPDVVIVEELGQAS